MPTLTQQTDRPFNPDSDAEGVFARMTSLKAYPDITVTVDEIVARLTQRVRVQFSDLDKFTQRFGKKIRALGGDFSECRGHTTERTVYMPTTTPEARALLDAMLTEVWAFEDKLAEARKGRGDKPRRQHFSVDRAYIVASGSLGDITRCVGQVHAWVTVQYSRSTEAFIADVRAAVESSISRNIMRTSWPDPRMTEGSF
jgi:hypothetical protein